MTRLKALYINLICTLYPYEDIAEHETLNNKEMLYNLTEIAKNNFDITIEEDRKDLQLVLSLIEIFNISGVMI